MSDRARRRRILFAKSNLCGDCGNITVLEGGQNGGAYPDNLAVLVKTTRTLEADEALNVPTTELVCQKCATERNLKKEAAIGIERLRLRSSPQGMCNCPTCGNRHFKSIEVPKSARQRGTPEAI